MRFWPVPLAALLVVAVSPPALPDGTVRASAHLQAVAAARPQPPAPASPLTRARLQARAAQSAALAARSEANQAAHRADQARAAWQAAATAAESTRSDQSARATTRMLAETQTANELARAQAAVNDAQQTLDRAQRQAQDAGQQGNLFAQADATAARLRLSMAQQQLAMAQSRATQQALGSGLESGKAAGDATAANDAGRTARLRYRRLLDVARIADVKARAYEQAAVEAWQEVERLRKALDKAKPRGK